MYRRLIVLLSVVFSISFILANVVSSQDEATHAPYPTEESDVLNDVPDQRVVDIVELRRQHAQSGRLLDLSDVEHDKLFRHALEELAANDQTDIVAVDEASAANQCSHIESSSPSLLECLRLSAARLEERACRFEQAGEFLQADACRNLAQRLRIEARSL